MTPDDLDKFKQILLQMQADLDAADEIGKDAQKIVTLDQQSVGRLSRMDAMQHQAMAKANSQRRQDQARAIEAALERIADGSFGECLDCGEDIPPKRIEFNPTAPRCVSCASG